MRDVIFLALTVGFFALAAAYIGGCGRIVGREAVTDRGLDAADGDAEDPDAETAGVRR